MAPSSSPAIRRTRLGSELRRLREQAGLTCEAVGRQLECSGTRVSRLETGRISVRPGDVREMLDLYGVAGREAGDLVRLAREVRRKSWWHAYSRIVPPWFGSYLGLESEAGGLRDFQPMAVPALLQTEEYARAVLRAAPDGGAGDPAGLQVALRMQRQAILTRPSPPGLRVVIGEGALRAQAGGPAVMRAQLSRLAGLAARPAITLQVLPLRSACPRGPGATLHDPGLPGGRRPAGRLPRAPHRRLVPRPPGRDRALRRRLRPPLRPGSRPRRVGGPDRPAGPRVAARFRRVYSSKRPPR